MKSVPNWKRIQQRFRHWLEPAELAKLTLIVLPFVVAAVAFFWRFRSMGLSHWDEYYFTGTAAAMSPKAGWGHLYPYDPPLFALFLYMMFQRFGFYDYVAVATSGILAFILCIATFLWVNREYDLTTAVMSTSLLATTELFIFYAKMALSDMAFTLFFSLAMFAYFHALKNQKGSAYFLAGIVMTLAIVTKYNGFQPLLIVAIFVLFFHFVLIGRERGLLRHKAARWVRSVLSSFAGLWLSAFPALIFAVLFLAFLGKPFRLGDLAAMRAIGRDFIPRISEGLAYFVRIVYPTKTGVFKLQLLVNARFYTNVLIHFIATPVLGLALVGAFRGIVKRNLSDILLTIWGGFIFLYFASTATTYTRVMLPAVVPIAILAATGLSWIVTLFGRCLSTLKLPTLRKRSSRTAFQVSLVIAVVAVNLFWAAPAITNTHSAYRTAAEFIAKNVPDGQLVWIKAQPVLIAYLGMMGKHVAVADNISNINEAYVIVLDFLAQVYPEWPQIEARISQMQLVFSVKNDVPVVNVLDSISFSHLSGVLSDSPRMSIRIYSKTGQISVFQQSSSQRYGEFGQFEQQLFECRKPSFQQIGRGLTLAPTEPLERGPSNTISLSAR